MEPRGLLPPLQEPATCPSRQPDQSSPYLPFHFLEIHFSIMPQSRLRSSQWSVSLGFPHQNPVCTFSLHIRATCRAYFILLEWITWIIYRSFSTRVSQLKIWHFWVTGIERNVCRRTFNRYSVITQFTKFAAGVQLCRRCNHRKL